MQAHTWRWLAPAAACLLSLPACAGLCAAGHTRLAPVRIVEIDTATHSAVSYVVRPARYTTAGTVMVDAPPREYEVTFDGMGFVR